MYEAFFATVEQTVPLSQALMTQAHVEARSAGLGVLDALHVAAAHMRRADEAGNSPPKIKREAKHIIRL